MTIKQARKVLGILGKDVSDEELDGEIEIANFFAQLYFENYLKSLNGTNSMPCIKGPNDFLESGIS